MNPAGTLYCVKCGANLQDELNRQQAIEARRLYVEAIKKEKREKKKKQARIVLPIYFACLLFLLAVIYYNNNLSAAARLRKDTALANSTRITQQAVEDLRSQYPYHGSNGIYSIYLKDVCIKYDATDQHWLSITHFIYTLDDPTMGFNWDFENTHMEDNLGNSYNVTYNTTYSGTGQVQNYFNGDAIDIADMIRDTILAAQPLNNICSSDCRGLCPKCGADLNKGDCGCDRFIPDPRLAALQHLLKKK